MVVQLPTTTLPSEERKAFKRREVTEAENIENPQDHPLSYHAASGDTTFPRIDKWVQLTHSTLQKERNKETGKFDLFGANQTRGSFNPSDSSSNPLPPLNVSDKVERCDAEELLPDRLGDALQLPDEGLDPLFGDLFATLPATAAR